MIAGGAWFVLQAVAALFGADPWGWPQWPATIGLVVLRVVGLARMGTTPGMALLNLRAVDQRAPRLGIGWAAAIGPTVAVVPVVAGTVINWPRAVEDAVGVVVLLWGLGEWFAALSDPYRRALHDRLTGTRVVYEVVGDGRVSKR